MTLVDKIKDNAYMVISDLAFIFNMNNNCFLIIVYNLKNIKQVSEFRIVSDNSILFVKSNMSEANKYKSIALIERNKYDLIEGYKSWVSTQKNV